MNAVTTLTRKRARAHRIWKEREAAVHALRARHKCWGGSQYRCPVWGVKLVSVTREVWDEIEAAETAAATAKRRVLDLGRQVSEARRAQAARHRELARVHYS